MIAVEQLGKNYGKRTVLSDATLEFPSRGLTSLIGPNGAGKSTLLMLIARLLRPSQGEVLLDGRKVSDIPSDQYARRVAILRQAGDLQLRLSVEELVAFGRFPHSRGALTAHDRRCIDEAIDFMSLAPLRRQYIDELSGGQRQMALLAMTIAQQTEHVLLDEPINNLDMAHAVHLMQALRSLCDDLGRTVILVVHDINFAANYSDHIVAMKAGKVHRAGKVDDIVTEDYLRRLYDIDIEVARTSRGYICNYFLPSGSHR